MMRKRPRRFRRRRFVRRRKSFVQRTLLAPKFTTKLRYFWSGSIDPGASGLVATQLFRANSLYDPDYTGGGS